MGIGVDFASMHSGQRLAQDVKWDIKLKLKLKYLFDNNKIKQTP